MADSSLKRTLVGMKDLKDQPDSKYILIVGSAAGANYIAVDRARENEQGVVRFYQGYIDHTGDYDVLVYMCRTDANWSLISRRAVELLSYEDHLRRASETDKGIEALHKEFHGDCGTEREVERADTHPGQYA